MRHTFALPFPKGQATAEELAIEDYHFVPGVYYSSNFTNGTTIKTLSGADATVTLQDGDIFINDAKITDPDYLISSGVMHVLDKYVQRFLLST